MRIEASEFAPAQLGLTNDPLILDTMNKASKGYALKGATGLLVGSLVFLALLVGFAAWCVLTA